MPDPGELDKRVQLRQRIDNPSADYGTEPYFQNVRHVWAKVRQVGATTWHESVQADSSITHYMTIRYRSGITSDYEVVFRDIVYRIRRARDLNSAGRYLLLECEELGDMSHEGGMYG